MRRSTFVSSLLVLALSATSLDAQVALKVGYINSAAILEQAPGAQAAKDQFEQEFSSYQTEIQEMAQELQTLMEQYEQQQLTLSADAKARREGEIRQKQGAYQARLQELDEQAGQREQELVQPVMDRISRVIEEIREEGSYSLIFDVSAGSIISADPSLDLTDEVVSRLQSAAPGSPGGS